MLKNDLAGDRRRKRSNPATLKLKRFHVQSFESSNKTMTAYCEEHKIAISTFSAWVSQYGQKEAEGFVPIQTPDPISTSASTLGTQQSARIEIHRGELKVVLPLLSDAQVSIEIIRGILLCN